MCNLIATLPGVTAVFKNLLLNLIKQWGTVTSGVFDSELNFEFLNTAGMLWGYYEKTKRKLKDSAFVYNNFFFSEKFDLSS